MRSHKKKVTNLHSHLYFRPTSFQVVPLNVKYKFAVKEQEQYNEVLCDLLPEITLHTSAAIKFESIATCIFLSFRFLFIYLFIYLFILSFICTFLFCPFFLHCFLNSFFQIPVYLGASHSLLATPPFEDFYGKDGLGDFVYPDPPNPADYLKREHAAVALARLASQYPSMSLFLSRPPKDNSQIDPLHISVELLCSPFGVSSSFV